MKPKHFLSSTSPLPSPKAFIYSRKMEPVNLYCSINRAAQCLLKFWAISCNHIYLSKIYMIIMGCSWAMALCQPIVISTLVLPGQNSVSTTRSNFIRFLVTQTCGSHWPCSLLDFNFFPFSLAMPSDSSDGN